MHKGLVEMKWGLKQECKEWEVEGHNNEQVGGAARLRYVHKSRKGRQAGPHGEQSKVNTEHAQM